MLSRLWRRWVRRQHEKEMEYLRARPDGKDPKDPLEALDEVPVIEI